jgi:hypothetical protein
VDRYLERSRIKQESKRHAGRAIERLTGGQLDGKVDRKTGYIYRKFGMQTSEMIGC